MSSTYSSLRSPISPKDQVSPEPLDLASTVLSEHESLLKPPPLDLSKRDQRVVSARQLKSSRFLDLTPPIIQKILWTVNANEFASLCLLNRQWYQESQDVQLYAHHLSRCPSYALANSLVTGPFRRNDLYRLKTKFAAEVRRNLFDAYSRPRRTLINLISVSANSSAAFPGSEVFRFSFSPNGKTILALSSSRIYVLDATTDTITVKRELKTSRRPLAASVTDDGSLLAVLSSKFQANIYGLPPDSSVKHLQVIVLDNPPRTIAITHEGTVLAAAYETGIEVFSLAINALSTDRRAVRSEAVDTLSFSGDGSMLVGSSLKLDEPNAVVITAPFYSENDPDLSTREVHSRMWTTQILFPQISSVCSHIALLPSHTESDATWLFAYDHSLLSYRAVRTDDTRAGVAYFLNPPSTRRFSMPAPTIAPSASACGTLAVAGFGGAGLCLYGIPEKLDVTPDMGAVIERHERRLGSLLPLTSATGNIEPLMAYSPSMSGISDSIEDDSLASKVDWRQSVFVKCEQIPSIDGHVAAKWVEKSDTIPAAFLGKRLLVVAPGGVNNAAPALGDEVMPVDGSRICLLDFDYCPGAREDREITIEVGDNEPELLIEYTGTMATEVAMERRRTVRGTPGPEDPRMSLNRSFTAISPPSSSAFSRDAFERGSVSQPSSPADDRSNHRLDVSAVGLQRSLTVAGYRRAQYPPRPPIGSQPFNGPNPDNPGGRRSSADSWETPPPPYPVNRVGSSPVALNRQIPALPAVTTAIRANNVSSQPAVQRQGLAAPSPQPYLPYRAFQPRASTTMDGMPTSEAAPSRVTMSQYGALARSRRDPSVSSLDSVAETPFNRGAVRSALLSPTVSESTSSASNGYSVRQRPLTHHGASQLQEFHYAADHAAISPFSLSPKSPSVDVVRRSDVARPISLTGANLQNRLNHPVPPLPGSQPSEEPAHISFPQRGVDLSMPSVQPQHIVPVAAPFPHVTMPEQQQSPVSPVTASASYMQQPPQTSYPAMSQVSPPSTTFSPAPLDESYLPVLPSADQMDRLNKRMSQTIPRRPLPPNTTNNIARTSPQNYQPPMDPMRVPPSPPPGAWGAAGVPGTPSFHQARNNPASLSPRHSREFARYNNNNPNSPNNPNNIVINSLASLSTPNLHSRPPYGRLDTIESINEANNIPPNTMTTPQNANLVMAPPTPRQNPRNSMMMRAQSVFLPSTSTSAPDQLIGMVGDREPSAYAETRRAVPAVTSRKGAKKSGRRRDHGGGGHEQGHGHENRLVVDGGSGSGKAGKKSGSKCLVM